MAEFLLACVVAGVLFGVVMPLVVMWVVTRIGMAVLWVLCIGDEKARAAYFPRGER